MDVADFLSRICLLFQQFSTVIIVVRPCLAGVQLLFTQPALAVILPTGYIPVPVLFINMVRPLVVSCFFPGAIIIIGMGYQIILVIPIPLCSSQTFNVNNIFPLFQIVCQNTLCPIQIALLNHPSVIIIHIIHISMTVLIDHLRNMIFLIVMIGCHTLIHMANCFQAAVLVFIPNRASCLISDFNNSVAFIKEVKDISCRSYHTADMSFLILYNKPVQPFSTHGGQASHTVIVVILLLRNISQTVNIFPIFLYYLLQLISGVFLSPVFPCPLFQTETLHMAVHADYINESFLLLNKEPALQTKHPVLS